MDHSSYIKKLVVPAETTIPAELTYDDLVARVLSHKDVPDDLVGVNSSIELIRQTRGGSWPAEELTEEFDFVDLAWHEREFRDGSSFAYVIYNTAGEYFGCVYLYPMGYRTQLTEDLLQYDVDASWWVTAAAYDKGYYGKLYTALKRWLADDLPFQAPYYSNKQIPADD